MKLHYSLLLFSLNLFGCIAPKIYKSNIESMWPEKPFLGSDDYVGRGTVLLKGGGNLIGLIKILPYYDGDHELDSSKSPIWILRTGNTKKEDIETLYLKDISYVMIQNNSNQDSIELKPFGGTLAVLIGIKNKLKIYCRYWKSVSYVDLNDASNFLTKKSAEILLTFKDEVLAYFGTEKKLPKDGLIMQILLIIGTTFI